ncbi:MAG TPA: SMP-30/gluconolactonase/LRE family protein [Burkholderiaceae bacterium]|nr:SMP-30/gluconolactonase/LRE family protein [Burkholderiaceae bacterium]
MSKRRELPVECVIDGKNTIGESPVWSTREEALYWVDIPAAKLFRFHPEAGTQRAWQLPAAIGSIGLREAGGFVLALRSGFHLFDPDTGELTFLCHPEADIATNRLNDGKVSPEGRFWAGTMDDRPQREPRGHLYRLDADHRCTRMASGITVSNGLAWSPDGRFMYHSDSRAAAIYRHTYDTESGAIGPREVWVRMQPEWGRPDGAATDAEGCYWSCGISAARLNRFSPEGKLIEHVPLPVTHPTMPCFAGPELKTLYITSLRENLTDEDLARTPQAGGLFRIQLDVGGVPIPAYKG